MSEAQVFLSKAEIKEMVIDLLTAVGVPHEDADITAEVMADTDAKGIETHGIRWLDVYLKRIQAGGVKPLAKLDVIKDKGSLLILDANHGLGQVAMNKAIELGTQKAQEQGCAVVAVRNSNHFGATGYYAEMAAKKGFVAFVCSNSTPLMAPWGGLDPCIGTNPLAYGFPTRGYPVVLDMATTAYARGKVFVAARKGHSLPEGVALNKEGHPTTDPNEALEGLMLPAAGPKGFGLSLVIDFLAGIMAGANFGTNMGKIFGDFDKPQDIGHYAYFLNIEDFIPLEEYYEKVEADIAKMKDSRLVPGTSKIYMPGEIEAKARERNGDKIPIAATVWEGLKELRHKFEIKG